MTEMFTFRIQKKFMRLKILVFIIVSCLAGFSIAAEESIDRHLLDFSIEELMNIEVTTASRRSQKLTEVSATIFVITQDDIRRSGATSIPDALRMVTSI